VSRSAAAATVLTGAFAVVLLVLLFLRPLRALFPKAAWGDRLIYAAMRLIDIPEFQAAATLPQERVRLA